MTKPIPTVTLKNGRKVPALGLGTWHMGEDTRNAAREVRALEEGIDLGMTLVDTAEMYGEGGAEIVVGKAIAGKRDRVFLVSKVYPHNASRTGAIAACDRSLKRLATDRIDLYLLHWRGSHPLSATVEAFEQLKRDGKIAAWGVSNFDCDDMAELGDVAAGTECVSNQVLYHLGERGIEWQLLKDHAASGVMTMAYSPLGQSEILDNPALGAIARKHGVTPAAIALAFVMSRSGVVAIPKAVRPEHIIANRAAASVELDGEDRVALDRAFPPPRRKTPLGMI
ncbi:MAG TPA: aldo/keto reductase [Hyphomicrobiaceae bacterium]|nr:aldo/keto reductase [Hyphomicrobiaceae bacterium]